MISTSLLLLAAGLQTPGAAVQDPTEQVFGRVVDGDGQPVPGASIELLRDRDDTLPWRHPDKQVRDSLVVEATATSDEHGRFRIGMELGRTALLRARHDDLQSPLLGPLAPGAVVELVAAPCHHFAGTVTVEGGSPAGVRVVAIQLSTPLPGWILLGDRWWEWAAVGSAEVDEQGRFEFDVPAGAATEVTVEHEGRWSAVHVAADDDEVELRIGASVVTGVVMSRGAPLPDARVRLYGMSWCVRTDERGRFTLPCGPATPAIVDVRAAGHRAACVALKDAQSPVEVEVEPAPVVRLRLVDRDQHPLEHMPVLAVSRDDEHGLRRTDGYDSDDAGVLRLDRLPDGASSLWIDTLDGWLCCGQVSGDETADAGTSIVGGPCSLAGSLEDAHHAPAAFAAVLVERLPAIPDHPIVRVVRADHAGRFRCPMLAAGRYRLSALLPEAVLPPRTVVVQEKAPALHLEMQPCRQVRGIVRDVAGDPAGGVEVGAMPMGAGRHDLSTHPWTRTGPDGRFALPAPESDAPWIVFASDERAGASPVVAESGQTIELRLQR